MTAFDKAREIVATWNEKKRVALDGAIEVARALLAYEPTPDARGAARRALLKVDALDAGDGLVITDEEIDIIASAITAAVAASEARVRAETIKECAKVADHLAYDIRCRQGERPLIVDTANAIASAIRALGGAR